MSVRYNTVTTMVTGNLKKMAKAFKSLEKNKERAMYIYGLSARNNNELSLLTAEIKELQMEVDFAMK